MNAIEIRGLCKNFGDKAAVRDLHLTVSRGELFSLLGVNGAGKTTTIRLLTCLSKPTAGDALLGGHSILRDSLKVRAVTGVSPQETAVARKLSVRENLELMARLYGASAADAKERAKTVAATLGLDEVFGERAEKLSGGWQRRLSIALALIPAPEILFLDEPTLGLDVLARRELWSLIEKLKGHTTVVLTTHYLEEAEALSDRIGIMAKGVLRAVGTADELKAAAGCEKFEDAFVRLASEEGIN